VRHFWRVSPPRRVETHTEPEVEEEDDVDVQGGGRPGPVVIQGAVAEAGRRGRERPPDLMTWWAGAASGPAQANVLGER
jgi:hypothetical protein